MNKKDRKELWRLNKTLNDAALRYSAEQRFNREQQEKINEERDRVDISKKEYLELLKEVDRLKEQRDRLWKFFQKFARPVQFTTNDDFYLDKLVSQDFDVHVSELERDAVYGKIGLKIFVVLEKELYER